MDTKRIAAIAAKPVFIVLAGILLGTALNAWGGGRIIIADVGFATPESAEYYADEDVYLVSNINGNPLARADNGFISKIKPDGSVVDIKWVDAARDDVRLDAPKGLAIKNGALYVADLGAVHVFALPSGKPVRSITIKGGNFFNGITPGAGDYLYVTDSGLRAGKDGGMEPSGDDAVYKVWTDGRYELILKDEAMGRPNGILEVDGGLMVVSFGSGELYRIDAGGKRHAMPSPPKGNLDGFIRLDDGRFLISSWGASAIYALDKDRQYGIFADELDAPADLGFDTKRKRVLVPLFKTDRLVLLPM